MDETLDELEATAQRPAQVRDGWTNHVRDDAMRIQASQPPLPPHRQAVTDMNQSN